MTEPESEDGAQPPRRGRPSVQDQRRKQIIDAFIESVATKGLEQTSLEDVADTAGMQRAALRHFVGNRDDLIHAAIVEITRIAVADMQVALPLADVLAMLFNPARMKTFDVIERAWNELMPQAMRTAQGCAVVKESYDHLLTVISTALRQQHPHASQKNITDTAYAIACLAEYNYVFQRIGYPLARSKGAQEAATALAAHLNT